MSFVSLKQKSLALVASSLYLTHVPFVLYQQDVSPVLLMKSLIEAVGAGVRMHA